MEKVLQFLGNHMILVGAILIGLFALIIFIIIKGFSFETKSGHKIRIGGITKNNKEIKTDNNEDFSDFLSISSIIKSWNKRMIDDIEETSLGLKNDCFRHADSLILKNINSIKKKYEKLILENINFSECENYKIKIFELVMDKAETIIKNFLYDIIDEGHFSSKTPDELEQMNENCSVLIDDIIDEEIDFDKELIDKLKEYYYPKIIKMSKDIIFISSKKYEKMKEYKIAYKTNTEEGIRNEIKNQFGVDLSDSDLGILMENVR